MTFEIELKLAIPPGAVQGLRRHPLLQAMRVAPPLRRRLHNRYFDTPELDLQRMGYAARLRKSGGNWLQTLKGGGSAAGGLHLREEWEVPARGDAIDAARFADDRPRSLLAPFAGRLREVFATDFWRTAWELATAEGDVIELALDQGEIRAAGKRSVISEVELELKAGNTAALYRLALALQETLPLRPERASKAERGYALYLGEQPLPVKANALTLEPGMTVAGALQAIAWNCVEHLQANEPGMLYGEDTEYLHQMRVALRRLRVVSGMINKLDHATKNGAAKNRVAQNETLRQEIKWLSATLGAARDWDVFATSTLPALQAQAAGGRPAMAVLSRRAGKQRQDALRAARRAVSSPRYARLLLGLSDWLSHGAWLDLAASVRPVLPFAREVLNTCRRQVRKRSKCGAQPEALHALRVAVKRLHYSAIFFAGLFEQRKVKRYVKKMSALQDILGRYNDLAVAMRLLGRLTNRQGAPVKEAASRMARKLERETGEALKALDEALRKVSGRKCFWEKN